MKRLLWAAVVGGFLSFGAQAQEDFHMPKPSPTVHVDQEFSTSFIKLDYSRPGVKGRSVFGNLIPYGEVWRTGANSATTISFGEELLLDGHPIKAGTYALYTIPDKDQWTVILNKGVDNWGASGFDKKEDVLEFKVPVKHLTDPQESFRISLENLRKNSADLVITWADVQIAIPIEAHNNERILRHLAKQLKGDQPPYAAAASYYLSTDQKLDDALKYINKVIEKNPKTYYLYWTRAQIYQKLDKPDKALDAAKKAAELAKGTAFEYEYQHHYETLKKEK